MRVEGSPKLATLVLRRREAASKDEAQRAIRRAPRLAK
jgi:hypothetical protein